MSPGPLNREEAIKTIAPIIEQMESRCPEDVIAEAVVNALGIGKLDPELEPLRAAASDAVAAFEAQVGTMRDDFPWLHAALSELRRALRRERRVNAGG